MNSLIFKTATRYLVPVLLVFAIHLLLRGHNAPGGGFAGGLVAAGGYTLYALAFGVTAGLRHQRLYPESLAGSGLLLAVISAFASLFAGKAFMTALWFEIPLPGPGYITLGTPFFFDLGVFAVVTGVVLLCVFSLMEVKE
jgi:multicomponent Na+:H+ antiporter subunit B